MVETLHPHISLVCHRLLSTCPRSENCGKQVSGAMKTPRVNYDRNVAQFCSLQIANREPLHVKKCSHGLQGFIAARCSNLKNLGLSDHIEPHEDPQTRAFSPNMARQGLGKLLGFPVDSSATYMNFLQRICDLRIEMTKFAMIALKF